MFTSIDHLMICVPDLAQGTETYRRLGFNVQPGGVHPGRGTHNAIMMNDEDYLELLAIHDPAEDRAAEAKAGRFRRERAEFIAGGAGSASSSCKATTWQRTWPRCADAAWT